MSMSFSSMLNRPDVVTTLRVGTKGKLVIACQALKIAQIHNGTLPCDCIGCVYSTHSHWATPLRSLSQRKWHCSHLLLVQRWTPGHFQVNPWSSSLKTAIKHTNQYESYNVLECFFNVNVSTRISTNLQHSSTIRSKEFLDCAWLILTHSLTVFNALIQANVRRLFVGCAQAFDPDVNKIQIYSLEGFGHHILFVWCAFVSCIQIGCNENSKYQCSQRKRDKVKAES